MTYEEAIKYLPMPDMDDYGSYVEDAFNMAIEALEKADKYRWHDLRKNPNDLPEECDCFPEDENLVEVVCKNGIHYFACYVVYGTRKAIWKVKYMRTYKKLNSNVIAWREIEPFEEEE